MKLAHTANVVMAFGRFNPPTVGHERLITFAQDEARKRQADVIVFPSQTTDGRKTVPRNPLPFREKVRFLKAFFPQVVFNENERIVTLFDALLMLSRRYERVWIVSGSDRVANFSQLAQYVKPKGRSGGKFVVFKEFGVLPVPGLRDPDDEDVNGVSASKLRQAAVAEDWDAFRAGVPTRNIGLAKQLYESVRRHMGITEAKQTDSRPGAFLLFGFSESAVQKLSPQPPCAVVEVAELKKFTTRVRNIMEMNDPFIVNVTNESYADIKRVHQIVEASGYAPTIYLYGRTTGPMTESWLKQTATSGMIQQGLARDVVVLESQAAVVPHIIRMLKEAAASPGAPKTPSEVDRLKDTQKQQLVLTKQRQAQELLQAKQRELAKKSREDMNKIKTGDKPSAITR